MQQTLILGLALLFAGFTLFGQTNDAPAPSAKSIAVSIVYDGSGSMADLVPGGDHQPTPKYLIANKAVNSIVQQMLDYGQAKQVGIQAGLVCFVGNRIQPAIPLAALDATQAAAFAKWTAGFATPEGGTPLGQAIQEAQKQLAKSGAGHKHILVITDGMSNMGISPERVVHDLRTGENPIPVYFVAFDVAASVFGNVKSEGATVVSASDEGQLNVRINQILGQKILLEAE